MSGKNAVTTVDLNHWLTPHARWRWILLVAKQVDVEWHNMADLLTDHRRASRQCKPLTIYTPQTRSLGDAQRTDAAFDRCKTDSSCDRRHFGTDRNPHQDTHSTTGVTETRRTALLYAFEPINSLSNAYCLHTKQCRRQTIGSTIKTSLEICEGK